MSPRTEETNQHIREEQRERILEAAQKIFARKGFTDTKMTDIAAAAKISYGLAYHYFANKEEIFTRLVESALKSSTELLQYARQQPGTPWDRLHWLVTRILEGAQREPEAFMVILQAFTNDTVPREARKIARQQFGQHGAQLGLGPRALAFLEEQRGYQPNDDNSPAPSP